ncbi:LysR substrate-binding domain-containing protein (plasmid) [Photobacterium sp. DA100]|uniref:LysR substrate-binding domain-containing protein n=1 Tax=Photobacterium sp. DA100 TaxID=3027472 RepID=UPI002478E6F4|nr:LysR substrate-binding domain-containing protein [Photobacterium sp. DA100]WEM45120.1 LysR substrate-binding domain-containing protein [Photobacterium sp. DA100]
MDKLKSMQVFVDVVERGSLAKAAAHFNITSTMVGKHLKALEQNLGTKLLNRTTRKQSLTEAGENYFHQCQRILDDIREAEENLQTLTNIPMGTIRINAPVTYGSTVVAPLVAQFLQQHPHIDVELIVDNNRIDPLHDHFDLVFRIGELEDSSLIARKVGDYQLLFCASPTYFERFGMPRQTKDLGLHHCLGFYYGEYLPQQKEYESQYFSRQQSRLSSNSGNVLKAAAIEHAGIILQPAILLEKDIEQGLLTECLTTSRPPSKPIHVLYKDKTQPLKVRTFIDFFFRQISRTF